MPASRAGAGERVAVPRRKLINTDDRPVPNSHRTRFFTGAGRTHAHALSLSLALLVLSPSPASANMPTSLLFPQAAHLLVGSAILGIVEGIVIAILIRGRLGRALGWMVAANYASSFAGLALLRLFPLEKVSWLLGAPPVEHVPELTVVFTILFFAGSCALEWPFCRQVVDDHPKQLKLHPRSLVLAHAVSYGLLIPFYVAASQTRLLDHMQIAPAASFAVAEHVWIFYLDSGGRVRRMRSDGATNEKVAAEPVSNSATAWLKAEKVAKDRWNLVEGRDGRQLLNGQAGDPGHKPRTVNAAGFNYYWYVQEERPRDAPRSGCCGDTVDLRPTGTGNWDFCADYLAWYGLMVKSRAEPESDRNALHLGFETPFLIWASRSPNVLPNGQVVYQLGDQIVLADLDRRRLGFLARGTGPLAVNTGR